MKFSCKIQLMKKHVTITLLLAIFLTVNSYSQKDPKDLPPGLSSIKETELKRDLFTLASDSMRGKRAGTLDELRAAAWLAQQAQKAGLEPAGDDGTYFQFFSLYRSSIAENSKVNINEQNLKLWEEAWIRSPVEATIDAPVVWIEPNENRKDLEGKIVAMNLMPPSTLPAEGISLYVYRYALSAIREQTEKYKTSGATAIILVADSIAESEIGFFGHGMEEGTYSIEKPTGEANSNIPVILVRRKWAEELQKKETTMNAVLRVNNFVFPSANVVARAPGTNRQLKEEYVLFSGHHDHDGIGVPVEGDSIWNGADDNATVSVALLAIGRAWVAKPGKRSALFVWHGAEERGLYGSRYFVKNPTVEKESILAVLNGDMIGRNEPNNAALLGAIPPHRNSEELVNMALDANKELTKFNIDTSWDEASHPENWYFRSDHLPYAQAGIPAIFFTTLLHEDYHTPRDEAERIDMKKLTKMTKWMYGTGWKISNTVKPPALDNKL